MRRNPLDPPAHVLRQTRLKRELRALKQARKRNPSEELDRAIARTQPALGQAPTKPTDAMWVRLPGSFEDGKRR